MWQTQTAFLCLPVERNAFQSLFVNVNVQAILSNIKIIFIALLFFTNIMILNGKKIP